MSILNFRGSEGELVKTGHSHLNYSGDYKLNLTSPLQQLLVREIVGEGKNKTMTIKPYKFKIGKKWFMGHATQLPKMSKDVLKKGTLLTTEQFKKFFGIIN